MTEKAKKITVEIDAGLLFTVATLQDAAEKKFFGALTIPFRAGVPQTIEVKKTLAQPKLGELTDDHDAGRIR